MSFLTGILTDFKEKRLWPVALVLVVALVAVPVVLSKPSSGTHVPVVPQNAQTGAAVVAPRATAVPAVSLQSTPDFTHLNGLTSRNPFTQHVVAATTTTTTSSSSSSSSTSTSTGSSSTSPTAGGTGAGSGGTTPPPTTTTTTTTIPTTTAKPAPTGLTDTQTYDVTFAITNSKGGLDTIDPLQRLSIIPSSNNALLVELGVLKGGNRVLFIVQPGTVVSGPGTCTPGPVDCEILSLGQDQIEGLSVQSSIGVVPVAEFAVTGIAATEHPSVAAATKARQAELKAGRDLLAKSTLSALSLFQYQPSIGAVVDLRDLTVGGN